MKEINYLPTVIQYILISLPTYFFLNGKFWITDGPLKYHRPTSRITRSYPSPLDNNAYTLIQEETQ
ncbi:hypothetical protein Hanom_Chr12g01094781 [Helianthus anomalus]